MNRPLVGRWDWWLEDVPERVLTEPDCRCQNSKIAVRLKNWDDWLGSEDVFEARTFEAASGHNVSDMPTTHDPLDSLALARRRLDPPR